MRLHCRDHEGKVNAIKRAHAEALIGRLYSARTRIEDIEEEFPNDPEVLYARGMLCRDHFGEGKAAFDYFTGSYEGSNRFEWAACNAVPLAPDEDEFKRWADIYQKCGLEDQGFRDYVTMVTQELHSGKQYWKILASRGFADHESEEYSNAAAILEVALLSSPSMPPQEATALYRVRAQCLRHLDQAAQNSLSRSGEIALTSERFLLSAALTDVDKAIRIDPYDAELFDLKSAWSILLGRPEEGLEAANRAIECRPVDYPKPLLNKASAMWALGRKANALEILQQAIDTARAIPEEAATAAQGQELFAKISAPESQPSLDDLIPVIIQFLRGARALSEQEINRQIQDQGGSFESLIDGVGRTLYACKSDPENGIRKIADLMSDFSSDTVSTIFIRLLSSGWRAWHFLFDNIRYMAAYSDGIYQEDAIRTLCTMVLAGGEKKEILNLYREEVIKTSTLGTQWAALSQLFTKGLARLHPDLAQALTDALEGQTSAEAIPDHYLSHRHKTTDTQKGTNALYFRLRVISRVLFIALGVLGYIYGGVIGAAILGAAGLAISLGVQHILREK